MLNPASRTLLAAAGSLLLLRLLLQEPLQLPELQEATLPVPQAPLVPVVPQELLALLLPWQLRVCGGAGASGASCGVRAESCQPRPLVGGLV